MITAEEMAQKIKLSNVLFIDIESVPQQPSFYDLNDDMKEIREKKAKKVRRYWYLDDDHDAADLYDNRSGIFAEFGKIVTISAGYFTKTEDRAYQFHVQSFFGDDERVILEKFFELLNNRYSKSYHQLCGHNIREFDVPYICRRAAVHGLVLPNILDISGKKPREVNHLDTMQMWKFGDRKSYVSLDLLCRTMGIDTPKTDISGEQVARAYWDDKELERIKDYCERDVVAVAELLLKFLRSKVQFESIDIVKN